MKNNNKAVIKKIINRSLKSNKKRNFFITTAIALTTLLIASVFSIGMSIMETMKMHETRLMGTLAHAAITRPTDIQVEKLKKLSYVKEVGTGNYVATVKNTPQMGDMSLTLHYFDTTEWENLRAPAYTNIVGTYPQKENEIMVPLWVLEKMGVDNPKIGMEIPLTYHDKNVNDGLPVDKIFSLSGWFTSYMHIRSGNIDFILVSEEFSKRLGKTAETDGAASVVFDNSKKVSEYCERLVSDLNLSENQNVKPVPIYNVDASTIKNSILALSCIVIFLILTGYLLIYNVLYISVSRDVRFYGLLKTIGTTPRQIKRIVTGQILKLCIIGIPVGEAAAFIVSFAAVPMALAVYEGIKTGTVISFSPIIYIGAALFALLTALLGAFKPAKKAAGITPVEAVKYTGVRLKIKKRMVSPERIYPGRIFSFANGKPFKMAFRNIFRDGKRAAIVIISLFLGMTTFTCVTTLITSMDTDNYVDSYLESDIELINKTATGGLVPKQKFDSSFIEKIKSLPGIESLRITSRGWMRLDYTQKDFGKYADMYIQKYGVEGLDEDYLKDNFSGILVGIDKEALASLDYSSGNSIDIEAFERGEIALISTDTPELFKNVDELTIYPIKYADEANIPEELKGKPVKVPVGGFVPLFFERVGFSVAPTVFVSNALMDSIYEEPVIYKICIDVAKEYEKQTLETIKQLTDKDYEISRRSKAEAREELREGKIIMYILGGGISLILAFVGILNFINVMSVGITVRRQELANLECVGMSRRQVRKMLIYEGLWYATLILILVFTAGSAVTVGIFNLFRKQATYAIFSYPFIPVFLASLTILAVCIITPEKMYRTVIKSSLVERLREAEY